MRVGNIDNSVILEFARVTTKVRYRPRKIAQKVNGVYFEEESELVFQK